MKRDQLGTFQESEESMKLYVQGVARFVTDLELRNVETSEGEKKVVSARIAVNEGKEKSSFFPCEMWQGTAEFASKFFEKGSQVQFKGYLTNRKHVHLRGQENEFTTTDVVIVIDEFDFVGKKKE